ncbi:YbjQ family protein [Proteinivorax hydrogeniformans]|uniref:UPF0145 protein PRVXH_001925 n=1 Tax=Proteinivorax hydrogeniformans TaxID=1826727 RepID=A0AAU8HX84_9FIRM
MTSSSKREYQELGLVQGSKVRAVHLGKDIMAGLRKMVGGNVSEYEEMMEKARTSALEQMEQKARQLGADAVIDLRYSSSAVGEGISEIIVYGTAVKFLD